MYLLVLYFPFISFLFARFFSGSSRTIHYNGLGFRGIVFLSTFCLFFSVLVSFYLFYEICLVSSVCLLSFGHWVNIGKYSLLFGFQFDALTSIMLLMILLISTIVHIYSFSYMLHDPERNRFISLLSLFTFFMLLLITSTNFLQLLLGWEGVGICSYLLVNFWSDRVLANRASLKALFFNRIGDFGMMLGLFLMLDIFKTLNFKLIFDMIPLVVNDVYSFGFFYVGKVDLLCFVLMIASIAKSAQFFLHSWLADAMEGPTPVSALIHAATMVTAGIFLLARASFIFQYSSTVLNIIIIFGIITTLLFSFSGQNNTDLKKIVASSTASQLAFMFFVSGLLDNESSIFHLFLHAFFKALLFLSAGSIIHGLADQQDIRKMGGLASIMPFNTFCFLIGSLSLIGMPAATGSYYSKDPIIEDTFPFDNFFDDFLNIGTICGVLGTFYYNLKIIRLVFFGAYKGPLNFFFHDATKIILVVLSVLVFFSFVSPMLWEILMAEDSILSQQYTTVLNFFAEGNLSFYREEEITSFLIWLIVFLLLYVLIHSEEFFPEHSDGLNLIKQYNYLNLLVSMDINRWGFEYFLVKKVVFFFFNFSNFFFFSFDRGVLEYTGPLFFINYLKKITFFSSRLQSGFLYHYILIFMCGVLILFILFFFNYIDLYFVIYMSIFVCTSLI